MDQSYFDLSPPHANELSAAQKWLKTSKLKTVDIKIDLRDPGWDEFGEEGRHPLVDRTPLRGVVAVLRGSEHRWRSITIKSDIGSPIHKLFRA